MLQRLQQRAAVLLHRQRDAHGHERDVHGHLLGHPDEVEVHVERCSPDRVLLDTVHDGLVRALAIDLEVDQGMPAGRSTHRLERLRVDLDRLGRLAVPVQHRGQDPLPPQAGDVLACDLAPLRGQNGSGHDRVLSVAAADRATPRSPRRRARRASRARVPRDHAMVADHPGCTIPVHERHDPHRRGRVRGRSGSRVRAPAGGVRRPDRAEWRGGPGVRHAAGARSGRPGRATAGDGWVRGPAPPAGVGLQGARPLPDGPGRRGRQGDRPGAGCGRLPDQAVRPARADEPHQGASPSRVRGPRGRDRWAGDPLPGPGRSTSSDGGCPEATGGSR